MIQEQMKNVEEKICRACERSGRKREEVTLIAVSKTKPIEDLKEAYACGARLFGENKVQEITEKYPQMPADVQWHMIGHLQRNKVKYIVDKVALIHSVDSLRLAQTIQTEAEKHQVTVPILLEVNVAEEESKFGVSVAETLSLAQQISSLPNVHIEGLMTIAPYVDEPEENRWIFKKMKQLSIDIRQKNIDNVDMYVLSMGMTGDYEVAIEEGATMVRVGTGIFGSRNYSF